MKNIFFKTIMLKGEAGSNIVSIEKTGTALNVDTYTITLSDGTHTSFEVTNGSSIESIEKTGTSGYVDTYTITLTNGDTSTFEVQNGEDGAGYEVPTDSVIYYDDDGAVPEGYELASDPEVNRIPFSLWAGNKSAAFTSGAHTFAYSDFGLAGKTIVAVIAAPNYASSLNNANCFCTCQIQPDTETINVYMRNGITDSTPADDTYNIALFIAYN